ncbi:bestrophin family ion channel [Wandonia haliotis]|uniref:Bestrophin family ion channel n=1 Tax=Wandonia haliotis TaxID=574963 RepID=A0ABP3Y1A3_9FLAO
MIKYDPKSWVLHILSIHKSDTVRMLWKELLYMAILTSILTYIEITYLPNAKWTKDLMAVYSLVGFVLSLLLVFRTNTGYERWWEGRKKWGELVNNTRNLAIKINASSVSDETKSFFRRMIPNITYAVKEHLRNGVVLEELDLTTDERKLLDESSHIPNTLVNGMYNRLEREKKVGNISDVEMMIVDTNLKTFADIYGACERIKNTPIPYSYSLFLKKFIVLYVTTMPLAFITSFGYWSILVVVFVFYVLVSMEVLAEEIEDPFGRDDNDLPTDELCEKIKANCEEVFSTNFPEK